MSSPANTTRPSDLFTRVATILDTAQGRVVRTVNRETVTAYWLIGREIVEALQGGDEKAGYGNRVIADLALRLEDRYGSGFSKRNLEHFRRFYLLFKVDSPSIAHPVGSQSFIENKAPRRGRPLTSIAYPLGSQSQTPQFQPNLSWSHYRAIMRVDSPKARAYYERESAASGWSKRDLERQIATQYYERRLSSKGKKGLIDSSPQSTTALRPIDVLKDPLILDFLNLPNNTKLHESDLEQAIVSDIQRFLLELGRGFSFVARQQRLQFEDKDFYVDLVFYNYLLRCFVLVDLKIGELTHQDIGQMDGYVRMYEKQYSRKCKHPIRRRTNRNLKLEL